MDQIYICNKVKILYRFIFATRNHAKYIPLFFHLENTYRDREPVDFSVLFDCADAREWSLVSDEWLTLTMHVSESIQG